MLAPLWNTLLYYPLVNALIGLYRLTSNLGLAIILLTLLLRLLLTPLVLPGMRLSKKMQELAPELAKLKEKYATDKQGLMVAQAALYKQHGANPASGCLPQILQLLVLVALFNAFNLLLRTTPENLVHQLNPLLYSFNRLPADFHLTTGFLYLDLIKPDTFKLAGLPLPLPGLFLILAAAVQFLNSKMMLPAVKKELKTAQTTPASQDDMLASTQEQMLYLFPLMTLLFGYQFPAGLILYWFTFSLINMTQQYFITGWGGLKPWLIRLRLLKSPA